MKLSKLIEELTQLQEELDEDLDVVCQNFGGEFGKSVNSVNGHDWYQSEMYYDIEPKENIKEEYLKGWNRIILLEI